MWATASLARSPSHARLAVSVTTLDEWRRTRSNTTRADFIALFPHPFLVRATRGSGAQAKQPLSIQPTDFHTVTHKDGVDLNTEPRPAELPRILPLLKAEGRPFPERISIGRATNCDLVLRDSSVSKLHGHFRDVTTELAFFTDAKSYNGTRVNGTLLPSGVATEIRSQMVLSVGRIQLVFMSPGEVYDWL